MAAIDSRQLFSDFKLPVHKGDVYEFRCDPGQHWKDWWIKTNADGFFNLLAWIAGLRVKGVKCFCLCGCYNDDEATAFPIGLHKTITIEKDGYLSFFANDSKNHYGNNKGTIDMTIELKT